MSLLKKIFNYLWYPYKQKYGWVAIYFPNIFTIIKMTFVDHPILNLIMSILTLFFIVLIIYRYFFGSNIIPWFRKKSKDCVWIQYSENRQFWWEKLHNDYFLKDDDNKIWYVNPLEVLENDDTVYNRDVTMNFLMINKRHNFTELGPFVNSTMQKIEKNVEIKFDSNREIFLGNNRETMINEITNG